MNEHRPPAIDISVVIERVRVVTIPAVSDESSSDRQGATRGARSQDNTRSELLLDGLSSALGLYRRGLP
ncbi:MAG: hypothetical protein MJE77_19380 [Proteobacteria bacterium]|nr:hypothetical protein [Pseudomonadota bacterium]